MNHFFTTAALAALFLFSGGAVFPASQTNGPTNLRPNCQTDSLPPTIFCPPDFTISLVPKDCDTALIFNVFAVDDQPEPPELSTVSGLPISGAVYPLGQTVNTVRATDLAGNSSTCSFSVTVKPFPAQLICDDFTNIFLDSNCSAQIPVLAILENPENTLGCLSQYVLEIDRQAPLGNGPWAAPSFSGTDVGKTLGVRINDPANGISCWGLLSIKDNLPPVWDCQNISVPCFVPIEPAYLFDSLGITDARPTVADNCSPTVSNIQHFDFEENFPCDSPFLRIISRRWQGVDGSGNYAQCTQRIFISEIGGADFQIPADTVYDCSAGFHVPPSASGYPFLFFNGKKFEMENSGSCTVGLIWDDFFRPVCGGSQRLERTWFFLDFCTSDEFTFIQNIDFQDVAPPEFDCPDNLTITLPTANCSGKIVFPTAVVSDYCSQLSGAKAFWTNGTSQDSLPGTLQDFPGNNFFMLDTLVVFDSINNFPAGIRTITYSATDLCGNTGICSFNLTLADAQPPTAVCKNLVSVSMPPSGKLKFPAPELDNGSADNCNPLFFKALRTTADPCGLNNGLFPADSLEICCSDVGDTIPVKLRVFDIPFPAGQVSPNFGNGHFSECQSKIVVQNSQPPLCTAPPDLTVDCANFDRTLAAYGGLATASCSVQNFTLEIDTSSFDMACAKGVLHRNWKVFGANGAESACSQKITVNYHGRYFVRFPDDIYDTDCVNTTVYPVPTALKFGCENLDIEFEDQVFNVVPDACYRIERLWTVKDRCAFDPALPLVFVPNPSPNPLPNAQVNRAGPIVSAPGTTGNWKSSITPLTPGAAPTDFSSFWSASANGYQFNQSISVVDDNKPELGVCANAVFNDSTQNDPFFWNQTYWNDFLHGLNNLCESPHELKMLASDFCAGTAVDIRFLLFLDLDNNGLWETVVNSANLPPANTVNFNNANTPNYTGGTAREFDARPVPADQKFGFAIEKGIENGKAFAAVRWKTQAAPTVFVNPQLPLGTHRIKWIVEDICGNEAVCDKPLEVKDLTKPKVNCPASATVFNIGQNGQTSVNLANFSFSATDNCTSAAQMEYAMRKSGTGTGYPVFQGQNPLAFNCHETGPQNVEIWAKDKSGNAGFCTAGISIADPDTVCLFAGISGNIKTPLGQPLPGATVTIASTQPGFVFSGTPDTTDSAGNFDLAGVVSGNSFFVRPEKNTNPLNGVTTLDLLAISKHILGTDPFDSPLKMIAGDANRSGSLTTFDIVELRKLILGVYPNLPNNTSWRFVDAAFQFQNPANPFQTPFPETVPVAGPAFDFTAVKVGDVNFSADPNSVSGADDRSGLETFFIHVENREFREGEVFELPFFASEKAHGIQFTLKIKDLEILEILTGENSSPENFAVFSEKNAPGETGNFLTMALETEAVPNFRLKVKAKNAGEAISALKIGSEITLAEAGDAQGRGRKVALKIVEPGRAELFQNAPNPFSGETSIGFYLPQKAAATLSVFDVSGRLIYSKSGVYEKGPHLERLVLEGSGFLFYRLETEGFSEMKRMILQK